MGRLNFRPAGTVLSVLWILAHASAEAGIIRHDRPESSYTSLAADPAYQAVGVIFSGEEIRGTGTLIHPRWVLTAAHVGFPSGDRKFVLGSQSRSLDQAKRHPRWSLASVEDGWDIGLHRLVEPLTGVDPARLYTETDGGEVGRIGTYVGYGVGGDGVSGQDSDQFPEGTKRAGTNIIDTAGYVDGQGPRAVVYSDHIVFADFDRPVSPRHSTFGSIRPTELEYLIADKDSGGPLFVELDGQALLAAVHSFVIPFDPGGNNGNYADYGDIVGSVRIGVGEALDWINLVLPMSGDMDDDGDIDGEDIELFVAALAADNDEAAFLAAVSSKRFYAADTNLDGLVNNLDIPGFVGILESNSVSPDGLGPILRVVPEPTGVTGLGLVGVLAAGRRRRSG